MTQRFQIFLHLDAETGVGHFLDRRDAHIRVKAEVLDEPTTLYALKVYLRLLPYIQCERRVWLVSALLMPLSAGGCNTTGDIRLVYENDRCLPAGIIWRPFVMNEFISADNVLNAHQFLWKPSFGP